MLQDNFKLHLHLRYRFEEPEISVDSFEIDDSNSGDNERTLSSFGVESSDEETETSEVGQQTVKRALSEGRMYRDRLARQYFC